MTQGLKNEEQTIFIVFLLTLLMDLTHYAMRYSANKEELEKTHALIEDVFTNLFKNQELSDLLFDDFPFREKTPTSFFDIYSPVHFQKLSAINLTYLQMLLSLATQPQIVEVKMPLSDKARYLIRDTPANKIEQLQRDWFAHTDITPKIRAYEKTLAEAFAYFNRQTVLELVRHVPTQVYPFRSEKDTPYISKITERVDRKEFRQQEHPALDSAYYEQGKDLFFSAQHLRAELDKHPYGKNFRLTLEEERSALEHRF